MEEFNIFIIIIIIILLFFLSADKSINNNSLENNTIPLLLVLIIFYFCFNNLSMGILLVILIIIILSTTNLKKIIIERMHTHINDPKISNTIETFLDVFDKDFLKNKQMEREKIRNKIIEEKNNIIAEEEEYEKQERIKNSIDKNKNLLYNNEDYEKIDYDEFKKEIDDFEGKNNKKTIVKKDNSDSINLNPPDINTLMNKLNDDLQNINKK